MKSKNLLYITATVTVAAVLAYGSINRNAVHPKIQPVIETAATVSDAAMEKEAISSGPSAQVESFGGLEGQAPPLEIIRSIYDYDRDFQEAALAATNRVIANYRNDPDILSRWKPVRLETANFLAGNYLDDGSIKKSFQISPFPDMTFTVVEKRYRILQKQRMLSWEGSIVGSDNGTVTLAIVPGKDTPWFSFKIRNGPQIISITSTDHPNTHVAMEINPHYEWNID